MKQTYKDILNLDQFEKVIAQRKKAKDAMLKEEECSYQHAESAS